MSDILSKLEALLFVSGRSISYKVLAKSLNLAETKIKTAVIDLQKYYVAEKRGLSLILTDTSVQLFTAPEHQALVQEYLQSETHADLTRPQLETLSIIAYRGPIIKESLEQIRGVNCSMILRNLMIRGLIQEKESSLGALYSVTEDFLSHLGISQVTELPDYSDLYKHDHFEQL